MWFNAHAKGGIKNLKGATELELNFSARRPIKRATYEHSSPVPKPSGSPAVNAAKPSGTTGRHEDDPRQDGQELNLSEAQAGVSVVRGSERQPEQMRGE